jgi:hypothetical protein
MHMLQRIAQFKYVSRTAPELSFMSDVGAQGRRRKKVVVLRELHRATIYMSNVGGQGRRKREEEG